MRDEAYWQIHSCADVGIHGIMKDSFGSGYSHSLEPLSGPCWWRVWPKFPQVVKISLVKRIRITSSMGCRHVLLILPESRRVSRAKHQRWVGYAWYLQGGTYEWERERWPTARQREARRKEEHVWQKDSVGSVGACWTGEASMSRILMYSGVAKPCHVLQNSL